ncbi:uncharacterized protein LOC111310437 isoform X3 [Durio zibethinus]|nr:uncharacterized protein LOC111310437 isoform X3 [Durio zibethinus]
MRIMNMLFTLSHYLVVLQTISELVHLKEAFDMHLPNVFQSTGLKQMVMKGLYSKRSLSNGKQSGRADGTSSGSPSSASSKRGYEKKRGSSSMEEKDTLVSAKALIGDSVTILHGGRGVYLFLSLLSFIA